MELLKEKIHIAPGREWYGFLNLSSTNAPVSLSAKPHTLLLYLTKYGVNKEPTESMNNPVTRLRIELSKGDSTFVKIKKGNIVKKLKVNLPDKVILCSVSQLLHSNGLFAQTEDL